jgi:hypothetical protein
MSAKRLLMLAPVCLLSACGWFGDDAPSSVDDLAAIAAFNRQYLTAMNTGDAAAAD